VSICKYISDHKLQNPDNMYEIRLDKPLQLLFNVDPTVKSSVIYAELQCFILKHMKVSPIDIHNRKFKHVMSELSSQSSRLDLRRLA
jgi:chromatin remodeling complex protein RSC6